MRSARAPPTRLPITAVTVDAVDTEGRFLGGLILPGFGLMLRVFGTQDRKVSRILGILADKITQHFSGDCLVGSTIIPGSEWESWLIREGRSKQN